jgi:3-carboxy-cis,cis-muconate cycloisomerase
VLPELVQVTAGAARAIASALEHFVVDEARMRDNLHASHGLPLAEAVSMALAGHVGKPRAHALIEGAVRDAMAHGRPPLADVLCEMPEATEWIPPDELRRQLAPEHYLGVTGAFIERALKRYEAGS